jgi:DNA-binding SARP family transcriptional activator
VPSGFVVGDLTALVRRLQHACQDLESASARTRQVVAGRHGIVHASSAQSVARLWVGWASTIAAQSGRCAQIAVTIAEVSHRYRATDNHVAGIFDDIPDHITTVRPAPSMLDEAADAYASAVLAEPAEALTAMVATCRQLAVDLDTVAHTIAEPQTAVDWWGSAADAASAAIRDLSSEIRATADAFDGLTQVFAGYAETVWIDPARLPMSIDAGADLADQASAADLDLRAGISAWTPSHHILTPATADHAACDALLRHAFGDTPMHTDAPALGHTPTAADDPSPQLDSATVGETYQVKHGDTLWAIARHRLGDARRWRTIFQLNEGRLQRDGRRLTDPRLILPGWRLRLPAADTTGGTSHAVRPGPPAASPHPAPATPTLPVTPPNASPPRPPTSPDRESAGWPTVEVGIAAAVGAGVGWTVGRRRHRNAQPDSIGRDRPPTSSTTHGRSGAAANAEPAPAPVADHARRSQSTAVWPSAVRGDPTPSVVTHGESSPARDRSATWTDTAAGSGWRAAPIGPAPAEPIPRSPDDWDRVGRGLTGPGAYGAARTILADAVTHTDHELAADVSGDVRVVITAAAAATLLQQHASSSGRVPGIAVVSSLRDGSNLLDEQILRRRRLVADRDADPAIERGFSLIEDQQWPPLLLIAETAAAGDTARLAAILLQGAPLGIDAVILGAWPTGDTITIDADGHTTDNAAGRPAAGRPLRLTDVDTARDLLEAAATATTFAAAVSSPQRDHPDTAMSGGHTDTTPTLITARTSPPTPSAPVDTSDATSPEMPDVSPHRPLGTSTLIQVRVLGTTPTLLDAPPDSTTNPPWRPQARELLAYLMCHPHGVAEPILFEDILGDVPGSKVRSRLNTYLYNLHQKLRAVAGPGTYLTHTARGHILIDTDRIDCDLWRLHHHLRDADTATDTNTRITALNQAVAAYTGPLAGDDDYFWIPPLREATRRAAIDAHTSLAQLLAPTDPNAAIAIIERAIGRDPHNEPLYQQAIRLHATTGDAATIRSVLEQLRHALEDIGASPTDETNRLADELLTHPTAAGRSRRIR